MHRSLYHGAQNIPTSLFLGIKACNFVSGADFESEINVSKCKMMDPAQPFTPPKTLIFLFDTQGRRLRLEALCAAQAYGRR